MNKIDPDLFGQTATKKAELEPCPKCGDVLVIRNGKRGLFKACSSYPKCDYLASLYQQDGHIIKTLELDCPECGNKLVLRQGRFGMFIGCASYPSCQHIEKRAAEPDFALEEIKCPECFKGQIQQKQSRFGKPFYGCTCYPRCKFVVNLKPHQGKCTFCGYTLLLEKAGKEKTLICGRKSCGKAQACC